MSSHEHSIQDFSPSETKMWERPIKTPARKFNDDEINTKYGMRELRIVTESNREQLPNFVQALQRIGWMELRPFYQRRPRWDKSRQSKLIESFIMNVPVPPLFVYESDLAKYEVMDGQQRITAILDFYTNRLRLEGLEQWPELNGRIYDTLPSEIKKGIDRRSISYIVLLKESATTSEEETLLRQEVFERLNTGGTSLAHQEIRNALYQGKFNTLLLDIVKNPLFRKVWLMPPYSESSERSRSDDLTANKLYILMRDVEIVLRFFALRHAEHYQRGMKGFLDLYMLRSKAFDDDDVVYLRTLFEQTIELGWSIYGELLARPRENERWSTRPQVAYWDAVMVALSQHLHRSSDLIARRQEVINRTIRLFEDNPPGTFTGRGNTKKDVQDRIRLFGEMLDSVLSA